MGKKERDGNPDRPPDGPSEGRAHQARRGETDKSLRVERDRADAGLQAKTTATEKAADDLLEVARSRADEVVEVARELADIHAAGAPPLREAATRRERAEEDATLEGERALADSLVQDERRERKRYLSDFLVTERDATDTKLTSERAHSDQAIAARDDFLATVTHDLRSLLGSMVLNAELIKQTAAPGQAGDKTRDYAAVTRRLSAKMNRLISDLIDVVSIDVGKLAVVVEHVEVNQILNDAVDAFRSIATAANVSIEARVPSQPLYVKADDGRIAQVLANLLSNAIKFTPAHGKVSIRAERSGSDIVFTVADTGVGIPRDQMDAIFDRLHQVSTDRRGLGLGLYISRSLIEAHGGRMWAESELHKGSSFHFALPGEPPKN